MAPCDCGNHETQWSEFTKHLWCARCEEDFIPAHAGMFDGPIPVKLCSMMGIVFDRVIIATGELDRFDVDKGEYVGGAKLADGEGTCS
jgi:hypothetical protein